MTVGSQKVEQTTARARKPARTFTLSAPRTARQRGAAGSRGGKPHHAAHRENTDAAHRPAREESRIFQFHAADWLTFSGWTLDNDADAFRRTALAGGLLVSGAQVVLIAGVGLLVNAMAAYAFARLEFAGREFLFAGVVMLIILPVEVVAVPMFLTARDLGLAGGFAAAMAGLAVPFFAKAFNIDFLRQHFLAVPTELEEAAAIDGASVWRRFWNVGLPAVRPALATVVLLDVLAHWGDFLWPLMISTREETRTFRWFQRHIVATEVHTGIK